MVRKHHWLALLCLVFVTNGLWAGGGKARLPIGEFTARKIKPPKIDGKIGAGEWDKAFTTSGMMTPFDHSLQQAKTTMSVGFDEKNFYFLVHAIRGDREWKLWKSVRENDGYSFGDPSIEIWVTPPTLVPETYQNVINTYPAVLDQKMIPTRGYTAQGWKGNWTLGVTETDTQYIIEAAIPVKDFDGFDSVKDGDAWRFLICRTCPGAKSRAQASWSITQGFAELGQHPKVHLKMDSPVLQVHNITSALSGKYNFKIGVVGADDAPADVTVELRLQQQIKPAAGDKVIKKTVKVKAGGREELTLTGELPGKKGYFAITGTAGGNAIFKQSFPYVVSGWKPKKPTRAGGREARELDLMVNYGPENNVMILRADIIDLPPREAVVGGDIKLVDVATGKVLLTHPLPGFKEWYSNTHFYLNKVEVPVQVYAKINALEWENKKIKDENSRRQAANKKLKKGQEKQPMLPLKKLPPKTPARKVVVEVAVKDKAGTILKTGKKEVDLLRYKFQWADNSIGISDKVIKPWTPVTCTGGTVGVWNRKLELDGLGLLQSIDNGGVKQVKQMRLVAVQDGKEVLIKASAPTKGKHVEAQVELTGTGAGAGLKLSNKATAEFDGFVLNNLTIAPAGDSAGVDKLFLEIVLPESEATHYCTTAGGWAAVHDVTPKRWDSRQTASGMLIGDFVPYVWLTNSDRAFLWFADSDEGWITDDDKSLPTQELVRENGTVTLRIHFIEVPTELKQATTVQYGYMTFPSRPLPDGWRTIICSQNTQALPNARNTYFWSGNGANWAVLWPYYCSPFAWSFEKSRKFFDRFGPPTEIRHRPMVGSIAHSVGRYQDYLGHKFDSYSVDWGATPGNRSNANCTASKGPNDFRVYHYQQWVQKSGFRGLYIDENYLALEKNFITGNAYYRPDGRLQPAYNYIGLRNYFKRMRYMFDANGRPAPNLWQHISSGAAYHSWYGGIFFEGENVEPTDEKFDYIEVLPAGRMRAIGSAGCAGGAMTMMCQSQRHATVYEPKHTHQFVGWVQAHDIIPEQVREWNIMAQEGQFYRPDVEFIGYWKPENPVTTKTSDCMVSIHKVGNRFLAWVVNISREDKPVNVAVDFARLGLDRNRSFAVDGETGADVKLTAAGFTVPVLKRDYVAVHVIERPAGAGDESFKATFDKGVLAELATGNAAFIPGGKHGGKLSLVAGKTGKVLATGQGVSIWPHLNVTEKRGRIRFLAKVKNKPHGAIVATAMGRVRKPVKPIVPTVQVTAGKGGVVTIGLVAGRKKIGTPVTGPALTPGWHEFELAWNDNKLTFKVDGKAAGSLAVKGMNICDGTGKALLQSATVVFGGRRTAISAIDDVRCYR